MLFNFYSYLNFLIKSTNKHGVHSPFVFDLLTKCFSSKTKTSDIEDYKKYYTALIQNKNEIKVTDFGAGSKVFKNNSRAIHKMAKHVGLNYKRAKLLIRFTSYFQFKNVLEFGTSLGLGTAAIHLGNPSSKITTLEGCPTISKFTKEQFDAFSFTNIDLIVGEFEKSLNTMKVQSPFDLIYFDGNHQRTATLKYFDWALNHIHNETVFIFDDIHWSKEMELAWEEIKLHPKVKITIDTYQWGFVFFRKEQEKEHFTIRV